jgi:hypothetical protein
MRQDKLATSGAPAPRRRSPSLVNGFAEFSTSSASGSGSASSLGIAVSRSLNISYTDRDGKSQKIKVNVDVDTVDAEEIPADFKRQNCVYPQALEQPDMSFTEGRWEYENGCNELAWKLAWLNASKLSGRRNLLQKAVDAYQTRIEASERARQSIKRTAAVLGTHAEFFDHGDSHGADMDPQLEKNEEFSQLVAHTLQQALNQHVQPDEKPAFPQMM